MHEKKTFELPTITTYRRDELIVEAAFTLAAPSNIVCDRWLKQAIRPVSGRAALRLLLR